jgi:hypothetical protein
MKLESAVMEESTPPTPAVYTKRSSELNSYSGGNRVTKTTEDISRSMHKNLIFVKLSPNMMYAETITNAEFSAMMAPTIPPFIPAERVALKATVAA